MTEFLKYINTTKRWNTLYLPDHFITAHPDSMFVKSGTATKLDRFGNRLTTDIYDIKIKSSKLEQACYKTMGLVRSIPEFKDYNIIMKVNRAEKWGTNPNNLKFKATVHNIEKTVYITPILTRVDKEPEELEEPVTFSGEVDEIEVPKRRKPVLPAVDEDDETCG